MDELEIKTNVRQDPVIKVDPKIHAKIKSMASSISVTLKDLTDALLDNGLKRIESGELAIREPKELTVEPAAE